MRRIIGLAAGLVLAAALPALGADKPIKFWNLTAETITAFYLAPAGTTHWSKNQCVNDPDGSVDTDEMLRITGIAPGRYDARFRDASGRTCLVRNISIKAASTFSIGEKELNACTKQ